MNNPNRALLAAALALIVSSSASAKPIGKAPTPAQRKAFIDGAAGWLNDKAPDIVTFINANGCNKLGNKKVKLTLKAFKAFVATTASKTDILFVTPAQLKDLTGISGAIAVGVTSELKARVAKERGVSLGAAGRHAIATKTNPPAPKEKLGSDPGGTRFAHELLHIVLRRLNNEALGGGSRKAEEAADIANLHHQLTDYFGWSQFKQSSLPAWSPGGATSQCG